MTENIEILLRLFLTQGIGNKTLFKIIQNSKSLEDIIALSDKDLKNLYKLKERSIKDLRNNQKKVETEIKLIKQNNIKIISFKDEIYPAILKEIPNPPCVLYFKGNLDLLNKDAIAIVGTRYPSVNAMLIAKKFGSEFSSLNIAVISGFAKGIDTNAHKGAIDTGGNTIIVLGSGMKYMYPNENKYLISKILEKGGLFISEFSMLTYPSEITFPQRNRIISGLANLGVIVIEAAIKSGSLITAKYARMQNRRLFALPGDISSPYTKGSNQLLKEGAILIENIDDVLKFRKIKKDFFLNKELNLDEKNILKLIENEPLSIEEIVIKSKKNNLTLACVVSILMSLEMKKIIVKLPGMKFAILKGA